jgi:hypothetical protein
MWPRTRTERAVNEGDLLSRGRELANDASAPRKGEAVVVGRWPPILEGDGIRGLLGPMLAATAWAGATFREMVTGSVDPLALFMRLLAIGLTVRALFLFGGLVRRVALGLGASRARLVLMDEGLYARLPDGEHVMLRREIAGVAEHGAWQGRGGRRFSPVYVVGSTAAPLFVTLPPIFDETPGVLAERLMRWVGSRELPEAPTFPDPVGLASKAYDDAAAGTLSAGTLAVKHGTRWLRGGPYSSILLAIAVTEGWARAPEAVRDAVGPWPVVGAVIVSLVVPLGWILVARREIAPRHGLAMVLTPAEVLFRTRSGVLRTRWSKLARVNIDERSAWSVLEGFHRARALVLRRKEDEPIRYEEVFLGIPAEVAQVLLDAYRRGALPTP